MRILTADDTESLRLLIERILKKAGHSVELVEDGEAACARFSPGRFDLVILDVQMPTVDGYEAAARIRGAERAANASPVPILALTASAAADEERRCRQAGCTGMLGKPFGKDELLAAIASAGAAPAPVAAAPATGSSDAGAAPVVRIDPEIADLVPVFLEQRRGDLQALSSALSSGDFAEAARLAHRVAGSGASFGFAPITAYARALENAAKDGRGEDARRELERLTRYIDEVRIV